MKKKDEIIPKGAKIEIEFLNEGSIKKKVIRNSARVKKYILEKIISTKNCLITYTITHNRNENL